MKLINFMRYGLLLMGSMLLLTACDKEKDCIRGRGDTETRELQLNDLEGIRVNGDTRVFVKRGAVQRVEVKGQPNVLDALSAEVRNGVWSVDFDRCIRRHETLEVYITVPRFSSAEMIGSGRIDMQDEFDPSEFRAIVEGSGSIRVNVVASKVTSRLSGSGTIELQGASQIQEITLTGSGNVKAFSLITDNAGVTLSGSGSVEVHAATNLNVSISGSGNVYYQGNPTISSNISGSGKLVKR